MLLLSGGQLLVGSVGSFEGAHNGVVHAPQPAPPLPPPPQALTSAATASASSPAWPVESALPPPGDSSPSAAQPPAAAVEFEPGHIAGAARPAAPPRLSLPAEGQSAELEAFSIAEDPVVRPDTDPERAPRQQPPFPGADNAVGDFDEDAYDDENQTDRENAPLLQQSSSVAGTLSGAGAVQPLGPSTSQVVRFKVMRNSCTCMSVQELHVKQSKKKAQGEACNEVHQADTRPGLEEGYERASNPMRIMRMTFPSGDTSEYLSCVQGTQPEESDRSSFDGSPIQPAALQPQQRSAGAGLRGEGTVNPLYRMSLADAATPGSLAGLPGTPNPLLGTPAAAAGAARNLFGGGGAGAGASGVGAGTSGAASTSLFGSSAAGGAQAGSQAAPAASAEREHSEQGAEAQGLGHQTTVQDEHSAPARTATATLQAGRELLSFQSAREAAFRRGTTESSQGRTLDYQPSLFQSSASLFDGAAAAPGGLDAGGLQHSRSTAVPAPPSTGAASEAQSVAPFSGSSAGLRAGSSQSLSQREQAAAPAGSGQEALCAAIRSAASDSLPAGRARASHDQQQMQRDASGSATVTQERQSEAQASNAEVIKVKPKQLPAVSLPPPPPYADLPAAAATSASQPASASAQQQQQQQQQQQVLTLVQQLQKRCKGMKKETAPKGMQTIALASVLLCTAGWRSLCVLAACWANRSWLLKGLCCM